MARADITVRGAGIFGLSIAFACQQRGARVRLVDPHGPGAGASGGLVGALAPHVPENWNDKKTFQLDSLLMAESFWSDVERLGGVSAGYGRMGRLQPISDDHALSLARERTKGAQALWRGQALWEVIPHDPGNPFCPHAPSGFVIHDTLSARIHPRRACAALSAALTALGVPMETQAPDEGVVIWATGWQGLESLSGWLGRKIGDGVKGQAALLGYNAPDAAQVFCDGLHIVPHADGTVAIGSTSERDWKAPHSVDDQIEHLIDKARRALPCLVDAPVLERWAGIRPRARTRAPLVGEWPGRAGHFIANGGFKIGFGMAPKIAEAMADLVLTGDASNIPEGFRLMA